MSWERSGAAGWERPSGAGSSGGGLELVASSIGNLSVELDDGVYLIATFQGWNGANEGWTSQLTISEGAGLFATQPPTNTTAGVADGVLSIAPPGPWTADTPQVLVYALPTT